LAACSERIRAAKGNLVTANELLALLGRAWSRLLIYPGGLAAFATAWLVFSLLPGWRFNKSSPPHPITPSPHHSLALARSARALPWLALALLPLPLAVALPRQIDIVVALALLEWPNVLAIRQDLHAGDIRRLAAALNSYPPLILATLALAQAGNSLELAALARPPSNSASTITGALHWLGAVALALALPPALGIGPFADDRRPTTDDRRLTVIRDKAFSQSPIPSPHSPLLASVAGFFAAGALQIGLRLRALGLVALAALPWAGAEGTGMALVRLLGAAALIAALLWGYDRLMRRQAARRWAWAYMVLDAVLLLGLLGAAYLALQIRLA
jgi:hypothetical protein